MTLRSPAEIACQIEDTYVLWEWFAFETGAMINLFQVLVAECRLALELTPDDDVNRAVLHRIYQVVSKLQDNWRAHVDQELELYPC